MAIRLVTNGCDCTFTNMNLCSEMVRTLLNALIWQDEVELVEVKHSDETLLEIAEGGEGVNVSGHWYCLPDAVDVVTDYISNILVKEWKEQHENMLYVAEDERWEDRETTIELIMNSQECSREEALSHVAYSIKHGILYDVDNYLLHFEI